MPAIYPKVSRAKLKQGARKTSSGRGRVALPGVKTDAKQINKGDYADNRELARLISKAMRAAKKSDKAGQQSCLVGASIQIRIIRAGKTEKRTPAGVVVVAVPELELF